MRSTVQSKPAERVDAAAASRAGQLRGGSRAGETVESKGRAPAKDGLAATPRMVAQREQLRSMFGDAIQREVGAEEEELQMKVAPGVLQRQGAEDEELLQGRFAPVQKQGLEDEEELVQGRFETAQREEEDEDALQSKTGHRALADLVGRQRRGGLSTSAPVVQRKLLFGDQWYGKGDEGKLAKERLPGSDQHLPGWSPSQLESEAPFVLNATMTEWVLDPGLSFYRVKGGKVTGKKTSSARNPRLLDDIGFGDEGAERVGPNKPKGKMVTTATILKNNENGHWSLECIVERGDGKKPKPMKIDLISNGYRLLYGAEQPRTEVTDVFEFTLANPVPVESVYGAMAAVARERGHYSMVKNNCRVFAHAMREKLAAMSLNRSTD